MKVLIIDADPLIRSACTKILEHGGFACTAVENGEQALSCVRRAAFDVALLDMSLPGRSGSAARYDAPADASNPADATNMDMLQKLREEAPHTAIIIITARASIDSAVATVRAGAFDYLPKPFNAQELIRRVRQAGSAMRQALEAAFIQRELERENLARNRPPAAARGRVARLIQGAGDEGAMNPATALSPAGTREPGHNPGHDNNDMDAGGSLARLEAVEIRNALARFAGNKTRAAAHLGINRKTLREKMSKYAIVYNRTSGTP